MVLSTDMGSYCQRRKQVYCHKELCSVKHRCDEVLVFIQQSYPDNSVNLSSGTNLGSLCLHAHLGFSSYSAFVYMEHEKPDN